MGIIRVAAARAGVGAAALTKRTWSLVRGLAATGWVPAQAAGLRGEIKEEAFAEGGRRGSFAPKACRPRRDVGSQACRKAGFLESRISVFRPSTAAQVGRWG